jgi:hypothetical protein
MFCNNCGRTVEDGTTVCPYCGQVLNVGYNEPVHTMYDPTFDAERKALADSIFNFGLWGLILGIVGCVPIVGLVLSILALSKAKRYKANYGPLVDNASTGNIMAIIGLVLGIIPIVVAILYVIFYIIVFVVMLASSASGVSYALLTMLH